MVAIKVLRWAARLWSLASLAFVLAFAFTDGRPTASELVALAFFPVGVAIGLVTAWRRESLGGAITVLSLGAFYGWMFLRDGRIPQGPYFFLVAAPGFLFLLIGVLSRSSSRAGGQPSSSSGS